MGGFDTSVAPPSPVALDIKPPVSQSPLEIAAGIQEQQARRQQIQGMQMENQQRQMDLQDQQTMRQAFQEAGGDWDKTMQIMVQRGVQPKTLAGINATILANKEKIASTQKAVAEAAEAQGRAQAAENDYFGNLALGVQKSNYDPVATDAMLLHAEQVSPTYKPHIEQVRALIAQDPANIKSIIDGMVSQSGAATKEQREQTTADIANAKTKQETQASRRTQAIQELSGIVDQQGNVSDPAALAQWQQKYKDVAPAASTPQALSQFVRSGVPVAQQPTFDIDSYKARMGLLGNGEFDQFLAQYARSLGKTPSQLTPDEGMASFQKFAEMKQDPQMRAAALAQKNLADTMKAIQLGQMPTKQDASRLADDIANHRIAPSQLSEIRGRGNGALGLMIEREMPKGFNWQDADAEFNLAKAPNFQQQVRYMDYVGTSLGNVISAADKLNNGKVRSLNAVKNWSANQLNGVDIARFNTDRTEVADAIGKILQGGGTGQGTSDYKLKQAQDLLNSTDSPQVVRTVSAEIQKLIQNRRQTLTKGTFMENAAPSGQPPAALPQVGHVVSVGGKKIKITAIHPDGTFDGDEVKQ